MKGRLLVVDDERGIVIALKGLFGKEGYEVETAESGEEALAKVKAGLFHVIITDLSMQGMSGLDLLRSVRQLDPECAVLMITAYGTQRIAVEAMKAGAEDYLPKPFDNDELRIKVRNVMEKQLLRRAHNRLLEQVQPRERTLCRHDRAVARDDARVRDDRQGRADRRHRADPRRVGHRQGTGRARDPQPQPARAMARSSRSIARRSRASWSRANCSATRRAPSPARSRAARASSRRPTAARCSSTRSAT